MIKPQHTPGPWVFTPGPHSDPRTRFAIHSEAIGAVVAVASPLANSPDFPVREANAHMLAAAVDTYEALEYAYEILGRIYDGETVSSEEIGSTLQPASDALEKARGQQ